jgi:hypothetical protein
MWTQWHDWFREDYDEGSVFMTMVPKQRKMMAPKGVV